VYTKALASKVQALALTFKVEAGYFSGFGTWGCQPTLGVPSLLLSPSLSLSLFPSFPPEAGGRGVVRKLGSINPSFLRGCGKLPGSRPWP